MKTIAMYLPQFYRVPENDEWWGEGFTEWTSVKNAKPLFEGHAQPKEPLSDYYYNLLDKETMEWQADLANKYNIYGMCFYHYWFKNGKRILEKPAENLLKWKDINMPFCFCWANESWARTWSNITIKNSWADKFEVKKSENDNGLLLEQKYGIEKDWKDHFDYLLPFFQDSRYIKIDNKPVFNIYKPIQIICLDDIISKWNEWAIEAGFDGIYIIAMNPNMNKWNNVSAYLIHEPSNSRMTFGDKLLADSLKIEEWNRKYSYDKVWTAILNNEYDINSKFYVGGFVNYDDTPRHAKAGSYTCDVTVEKFKNYFEKLVVKNIKMGNEYVFLNAWNEWGEGMYLEPDKENGYGFLEAINDVMEKYKDNVAKEVGYRIENYICTNEDDKHNNNLDFDYYKEIIDALKSKYYKINEYYEIVNQWLYLRDNNKHIKDFFIRNNYKKIAIYGMGHLGKHLYSELKDSEIDIVYAIDKRKDCWHSDIIVKTINEELPSVDVIIVTPTKEYSSIKYELETRVKCSILSIQEVIFEI